MYLPDRVYGVLKWLALIALPAAGTAYLGLAAATGLPHGDTVAECCVVLGAFLGALVGVSSYNYRNRARGDNSEEGDGRQQANRHFRGQRPAGDPADGEAAGWDE